MDIFKERRSIRKFKNQKIALDDLKYIADCGRLAPSGANTQPLKFYILTKDTKSIFECTKWAGAIDWNPTFEESPDAYIAILVDTDIKSNCDIDVGIAGTAMTYAAESIGISSCWLGAIDREKLTQILNLPENLKLSHLIGFGYADQRSVEVAFLDSTKYKMDENGVIYVPKRSFEEVVTIK